MAHDQIFDSSKSVQCTLKKLFNLTLTEQFILPNTFHFLLLAASRIQSTDVVSRILHFTLTNDVFISYNHVRQSDYIP